MSVTYRVYDVDGVPTLDIIGMSLLAYATVVGMTPEAVLAQIEKAQR